LAWTKWQLDHGASKNALLNQDIAPVVGVQAKAKNIVKRLGNLLKRDKPPKLDQINPLGL
jgi:hypothetical protein